MLISNSEAVSCATSNAPTPADYHKDRPKTGHGRNALTVKGDPFGYQYKSFSKTVRSSTRQKDGASSRNASGKKSDKNSISQQQRVMVLRQEDNSSQENLSSKVLNLKECIR